MYRLYILTAVGWDFTCILLKIDSLSQTSELVYPKTMRPTNMESSLTVPSIGKISNAQATSEASPKQVPSQPELAAEQEAKTEWNLVLVCMCVHMTITVFACVTQISVYCTSDMQTAAQDMPMKDGLNELVSSRARPK